MHQEFLLDYTGSWVIDTLINQHPLMSLWMNRCSIKLIIFSARLTNQVATLLPLIGVAAIISLTSTKLFFLFLVCIDSYGIFWWMRQSSIKFISLNMNLICFANLVTSLATCFL